MQPFISSYKAFLARYADFAGRWSRRDYWQMFAVNVAIGIIIVILMQLAAAFVILYLVFLLLTLIPSLAAGARRLHDTGKSAWFLLIGLIPLIGAIILIVFLATPGTPADNQFGPVPSNQS